MSPARYASVIEEADRAWSAAWELDRLRADAAASEWAALKVRDLIRSGRADDPAEVRKLAEALEARLRAGERRAGAERRAGGAS